MQNRLSILKWNYETRKFESHTVPQEWDVTTYEDNLTTKVNCACCGKELTYGGGFSSRVLSTPSGTRYIVCHDCFQRENMMYDHVSKESLPPKIREVQSMFRDKDMYLWFEELYQLMLDGEIKDLQIRRMLTLQDSYYDAASYIYVPGNQITVDFYYSTKVLRGESAKWQDAAEIVFKYDEATLELLHNKYPDVVVLVSPYIKLKEC